MREAGENMSRGPQIGALVGHADVVLAPMCPHNKKDDAY